MGIGSSLMLALFVSSPRTHLTRIPILLFQVQNNSFHHDDPRRLDKQTQQVLLHVVVRPCKFRLCLIVVVLKYATSPIVDANTQSWSQYPEYPCFECKVMELGVSVVDLLSIVLLRSLQLLVRRSWRLASRPNSLLVPMTRNDLFAPKPDS